ncbi:MAG: hypothetical protein JSW27_10180 [Phycisphaerales bacterium]|nr:MAG: hypothetical protein JSW27_10180 [Phycisphaerales bacterium]
MRDQRQASQVVLRDFPYPYRAMLAICSDLDETPNRHVYWEIMRFLNTADTTPMGQGVGLEVGNTIYFDMPSNQFAYWNTDDAGREMARALIRSGHIDCLHSYGDLATTRQHAGRALDELARHDCKLQVWIDHGTAVTNFDPDIMHGHGDEIGHQAYHADLTTEYGIKYVWRGRVTSVVGQDVPARLEGIWDRRHPIASGRTWLKEFAKQLLARTGNAKYAMHGPNETFRSTFLRDGRSVHEFMRCSPHWGGVSSCEEGRAIGEVLTAEILDRLVERGGTCFLYTHLGKIDDVKIPFNSGAVEGFRRLAEMFHNGRILVTTTRRLLGYRRATRQITWVGIEDDDHIRIAIDTRSESPRSDRLSEADLAGLTFYVSDPEITSMTIDGRDVPHLKHNEPDHTGQASVSLDWPTLEFPKS